MKNSARSWIKWGETEPYFGVLTDSKYLRTSLDDYRNEFWSTGEEYVAHTIATLTQHFGASKKRRALDFGCGVGRLTLALAAHFEEVVGIDVAPGMVAEARRNAEARSVRNASLSCSDGAPPLSAPIFDLVNSYIVLQHIPVANGMPIIDALLRSVAEFGMVNLHFSVDRNDSPAQALRYWGQCNIPGFNGLVNVARGRPFARPHMQMNPYPLDKILGRFLEHGFGPALSFVEYHDRVMTVTLCAQRTSIPSPS